VIEAAARSRDDLAAVPRIRMSGLPATIVPMAVTGTPAFSAALRFRSASIAAR